MKPPYRKPPPRGKKRPGRKAGHPGARRAKPARVDAQQEHQAPHCPDCGGPLNRCRETRTRYIEDIPQDIQPVTTEHVIHRDWCPQCQKKVEPKVADALPGSMLGHRVLVLTAWLHYALGNTLSQIVEVFNFHLQMEVTPGGLVQMWYRLQAVLYVWYEQIQREALESAVLHGDETGWRVNGKTHWLWCFSNPRLTYYMIHRSRGSPALLEFFTQEFSGVLISDFWGAYNAVACALRQTCLVHLFRDLKHVEKYKSTGQDWREFSQKLRRLLGDAIRLGRLREELPADAYASRRTRLRERLDGLIDTSWTNKEARRLIKRLRRHRNDLLTFLDHTNVPFENNHAEREIRPAVIIRKNSYGNRSEAGADAQAVLMTVFRTLKLRGHHPIQTIVQALRVYVQTNQLPPLPA
jgi:transposase